MAIWIFPTGFDAAWRTEGVTSPIQYSALCLCGLSQEGQNKQLHYVRWGTSNREMLGMPVVAKPLLNHDSEGISPNNRLCFPPKSVFRFRPVFVQAGLERILQVVF